MTYYTVSWDYVGGDCGDLPGRCDTEVDARTVGENWVAEALAGDPDLTEGDEGAPVYWIYRHEAQRDGSTRVYDEDDKFVRMIPA